MSLLSRAVYFKESFSKMGTKSCTLKGAVSVSQMHIQLKIGRGMCSIFLSNLFPKSLPYFRLKLKCINVNLLVEANLSLIFVEFIPSFHI